MIEVIQSALDQIEELLETNFNIDNLLNELGVSKFHFQRSFKSHTGYSPKAYVTKRRLENIIYEVSEGAKIFDTALFYGFDTLPGFYKAFRRYYGCTPKEYLKLQTIELPTILNLTEENTFMIKRKDIIYALDQWNIEYDKKIFTDNEYSHSYYTNLTFDLQNGYIFKFGKNTLKAQTQISICNQLNVNNVIAPRPIKTKDSKEFFFYKNRYFMLMEKVEGNILIEEEKFFESIKTISDPLGGALGKLHQVMESLSDSEIKRFDTRDAVINSAIISSKTMMTQWGYNFHDDLSLYLVDNLNRYYDDLPTQIIHRDPNPYNIIIKNNIIGFIDYEISEVNARIFDICYVCTALLMEFVKEKKEVKEWLSVVKNIFSGYQEVQKLTETEKKMVPVMMLSIQMIFISYLTGINEHTDMAKINCQMVDLIWNNKECLIIE